MGLYSEIAFDHLERVMPPVFTRQEASRFLGGLFTPESLRNLDCSLKGPQVKHRIGKKICYEKDSFLSWLRNYHTRKSDHLQAKKSNFYY
jgi:hypothetical protein